MEKNDLKCRTDQRTYIHVKSLGTGRFELWKALGNHLLWRIQGFPDEGTKHKGANISWKLHENEENWAVGPLVSQTESSLVVQNSEIFRETFTDINLRVEKPTKSQIGVIFYLFCTLWEHQMWAFYQICCRVKRLNYAMAVP